MIDYLEEVLEDGDREDQVLAGGRKVTVRPAKKDSPAEPGGTGPKRESVPAEEEEKAAPADRPEDPGAEEIGTAEGPEAWERFPEGGTLWEDWLSQTGREQETAGLLLGAMAAAGRSVRALGRSGAGIMTVTLPEAELRSPEPDLEALDLAMQRDARRYDGGFELY